MGKYLKTLAVLVVFVIIVSGIVVYFNMDRITPNEDFFELSIGDVPEVNVTYWELEVTGLVENELAFNYSEFLGLPKTVQTCTLKCVEGPFGVAEWGGVRLDYVLELAGVNNSAVDVVFRAVDGFDSSLSLEDARAEDVLLAYEMNGEPLPEEHGFPLRLVVPGKYGYKWVKWISEVEVVDYDHKGFWERRGWNDDASITLFSDWGLHAILLTISTVFCGLACVSGFKFYEGENYWTDLPGFVSRKFHLWTSLVFLVMMFTVFLYWVYLTYLNRGAVFYTGHGTLGLIVFILAVAGGVAGALARKYGRNFSRFHMTATALCFFILLGTIALGLLRMTGTF